MVANVSSEMNDRLISIRIASRSLFAFLFRFIQHYGLTRIRETDVYDFVACEDLSARTSNTSLQSFISIMELSESLEMDRKKEGISIKRELGPYIPLLF